ncbi:hypothetical protein AC629_14065 [Bradyrhizobium sp. NAS80.1]|nr:hypothetical protein AC629_14065 [Bradyrhizobium sp. NAS80.1]
MKSRAECRGLRGAVLGWPGKLAFMTAAALMPLFSATGILLYLSLRKLRRLAQSSSDSFRASEREAGSTAQ